MTTALQADPIEQVWAYQGQGPAGRAVAGTIAADSADAARALLASMGVHVTRLSPAEEAAATRRLSAADFHTFNRQLASLAQANVPLEQGLRLIAQDVRSGRLKRAIAGLATELESGAPVERAFEKHRNAFPPLYGRLVEAGVRSGNLPGLLLGFGRHLELTGRLRSEVVRSITYPAAVFAALLLVMTFIALFVIPGFQEIFLDFELELPLTSRFVFWLAGVYPLFTAAVLGLGAVLALAWLVAGLLGRRQAFGEALVLPVPMIGRVYRASLWARWTDAVRLGVTSGQDLPGAMDLAAAASGSKRLDGDTQRLKDALSAGRALTDVERLRLLPPSVPVAMQMGSERGALPETMATLAEMFARQAEARAARVPLVLVPVLLIALALTIGLLVLSMLLPMITLIQGVSG